MESLLESVDCKSAGVGANIALKTTLPVDIITSWGGGPTVYNKALRARKNEIPVTRVIIFMMTDRDLFNYGNGWEELEVGN